MAYVPDEIEIKGRKAIRNALLIAGAVCGLIAYAAIKDGAGQAFLVFAGLSAGLIYGACKVKTVKKLVGRRGIYL